MTSNVLRPLLGEEADDTVDRARNTSGQGRERENRADRDDGQNDAVLGHRLTLLLAPMSAEELEPIAKGHLGFTSLRHFSQTGKAKVNPLCGRCDVSARTC